MNLGKIMKQAQEMQQKMQDMQAGLHKIEVDGSSGGGMVTVTLNGKGEMRAVKIDPSSVDLEDLGMLEDLIVAAFNDAKKKVEARVSEEMGKITAGLPLPPGFNFPM